MSGTKKEEKDSGDEAEPLMKEPTTVEKYILQTTKQSNNSGKVEENTTSPQVDEQSKSKGECNVRKDTPIEILTQVVNELSRQDLNLSQTTNESRDQGSENASLRTEAFESKTQKPLHQQATITPIENTIKLDVIKRKELGQNPIRSKGLTEKEINEICGDRYDSKGNTYTKKKTPGLDPRFQQQNQTMRCFVMYTDFYRCENILGEGEFACQWFKDVFTSICPLDWIRRWDEARKEGRLSWTKGRTQGKFPGNHYGV